MEHSSSKSSKKSRRGKIMAYFATILLVFSCLVILVLLLVNGKETTTGAYPNPTETHSLTCVRKNIKYPKITSVDSNDKTISVTAIFNSTTSLRKITLDYSMRFKQESDVEYANAVAHASFSEELAKDKFSFTEFDNKFSSYKDTLTISVFGNTDDISSKARASYFMIDAENRDAPKTLDDYRELYEGQRFECTSTTDK